MVITRVLIIGGYGNFGSYIATRLASDPALQLIIGGRSEEKATAFAATLTTSHPVQAVPLDIMQDLQQSLSFIAPDIVIHTSGPYQGQSYDVAEACIQQGCHYIDLADARDFVVGISSLHKQALAKGVLVISGASSVPCLTSALLDHYQSHFHKLTSVDYAIATAQQTNRGLATTSAVLSYAGKPFTTLIDSRMQTIYGWQDVHRHSFPGLGTRWLGNCDIPDLELFPKRYPALETIRFSAGLEVPLEHLGLWLLTWLVRWRLVPSLEKAAPYLLTISRLFDVFGSDESGFTMQMSGSDAEGHPKHIHFDLLARKGDGPYIPTMPAILMAQKLAQEAITQRGAFPCMGFITLEDYLDALSLLAISHDTIVH